MILYELINADFPIWFEVLRNVMIEREKLIELHSTVIYLLHPTFHIRVSRGIKLILHLINVQSTISIYI